MKTLLYTAPWILPVTGPPIANGGLLVANDQIIACAKTSELSHTYPEAQHHHFDNAVIAPGWVNAHCHLELSLPMAGLDFDNGFVAWVQSLMAERTSQNTNEIVAAAKQAAKKLRAFGCVLVGDISNGDLLQPLQEGPERVCQYEILGFKAAQSRDKWEQASTLRTALNQQAHIVAHAPYSTSPQLMQLIKTNASHFAIHAAECPDEAEFIATGKGPFRQLLEQLDVWEPEWNVPGKSVVRYLDSLNLLDAYTTLVHGVQVDADDIQLLADRQVTVCICARSNELLQVGAAPVASYLQKGVKLCMGTDSLASNSDLDMNGEIAYIYKSFKNISATDLIRMATINGAAALGREKDFGSLEKGKRAAFNVFHTEFKHISDPERLVVSGNWSRLQCF